MILLDLDDTLVDQSGAERAASKEFGVRFASEIPEYDSDTFVQRWHDIARHHFADFLLQEISFQEQRRRRIREIFGVSSMPDEDVDRRFAEYAALYEAEWRPFPDAAAFLSERGKPKIRGRIGRIAEATGAQARKGRASFVR
jgi:putative hydrolase of the HAD superfamily